MKPGRKPTSPFRYDRAAIRHVLETEGREAALARWPQDVVDPIARVLGLTSPYRHSSQALSPEQAALLGTKPDSILAGEWNMARSTVVKARTLLGIGICKQTWIQREVRLRDITDRELLGPLVPIAQKYRLGLGHLQLERSRRGLRGLRMHGQRGHGFLAAYRIVAAAALREHYPLITLQELGEVFGLTRERVRQIEVVNHIDAAETATEQAVTAPQWSPTSRFL